MNATTSATQLNKRQHVLKCFLHFQQHVFSRFSVFLGISNTTHTNNHKNQILTHSYTVNSKKGRKHKKKIENMLKNTRTKQNI